MKYKKKSYRYYVMLKDETWERISFIKYLILDTLGFVTTVEGASK